MAIWLVDYENVRVQGLDGLSSLSEKDTVCIFYSENADNLTFGLHRRLEGAKAQLQYQKVEVGTKNALDFQLASYLGYVIKENEGTHLDYYIVTKDQGYGPLCKYWKRRNINVKIAINCAGQNKQEQISKLEEDVRKVVKDMDDVTIVVKFINQYKTKQGINNALTKHYKDGKKVKEIYSAIKPLIANKKGKDQ